MLHKNDGKEDGNDRGYGEYIRIYWGYIGIMKN